jgi:helix-turn-helix protein
MPMPSQPSIKDDLASYQEKEEFEVNNGEHLLLRSLHMRNKNLQTQKETLSLKRRHGIVQAELQCLTQKEKENLYSCSKK